MPGQHAIFSPSGFKALMLCPAKPAMERGLPDASSDYADEGTAAHFLASYCVELGGVPEDYIGTCIKVLHAGGCEMLEEHPTWPMAEDGRFYVVDREMADAVQVYIDTVHERVKVYEKLGATVELLVEQAVPIGHITGEDGAEGTSDVIIVAVFPDGTAAIEVIDLKYGRGVEISAQDNPQLKLYGLGAVEKLRLLYDITRVGTLISQPRVCAAPSEAAYTLAELDQWAEEHAKPAAQCAHMVWVNPTLAPDYCKPHPDACRFCKAKSTCPALASSVQSALEAEFTDLTTQDATAREEIVQKLAHDVAPDNLGAKMDAVELVEMWCKAIRARAESELLAGRAVAGWKLVAGRKSARQWTDAAAAEAELKRMRLKKEQMYDLSLISPTTAEKVLKAQPKRWKKVLPLIAQSDGKPSVAPVTDKRPALAIQPVESEFTVIPGGAEDLV